MSDLTSVLNSLENVQILSYDLGTESIDVEATLAELAPETEALNAATETIDLDAASVDSELVAIAQLTDIQTKLENVEHRMSAIDSVNYNAGTSLMFAEQIELALGNETLDSLGLEATDTDGPDKPTDAGKPKDKGRIRKFIDRVAALIARVWESIVTRLRRFVSGNARREAAIKAKAKKLEAMLEAGGGKLMLPKDAEMVSYNKKTTAGKAFDLKYCEKVHNTTDSKFNLTMMAKEFKGLADQLAGIKTQADLDKMRQDLNKSYQSTLKMVGGKMPTSAGAMSGTKLVLPGGGSLSLTRSNGAVVPALNAAMGNQSKSKDSLKMKPLDVKTCAKAIELSKRIMEKVGKDDNQFMVSFSARNSKGLNANDVKKVLNNVPTELQATTKAIVEETNTYISSWASFVYKSASDRTTMAIGLMSTAESSISKMKTDDK